jgi:tetratricopeptide (TPR) repeat protein
VDKDAFEKGYRTFVAGTVKTIPSAAKRVVEKPMTLAELEAAHEKDRDDVDVAARLADQYSRRKRAADARKLAEHVLEMKPGHALASIVKARLLSSAGDEDAARHVVEAAMKTNPDDPRLLLAVGRMAMEAKDWQKAAEVFEKGRKSSPVDGDWLPVLIEIYTKTENTDKLVDVLKEQVGNDPDDLKSRIRLATLLSASKKFIEAEPVARDAMQIDATDPEAQKALLEALEGQKKEAEVALLKQRFAKTSK